MTSVAPVSVVLAVHDPAAAVHQPGHTARPARRRQLPQKRSLYRHALPCSDDPELFFPVGDSGPALMQIAQAKVLCGRCPRTSDCLELALGAGIDDGVWGGTTPDERRVLRRHSRRARTSGARR